jgi:hypothetical protein
MTATSHVLAGRWPGGTSAFGPVSVGVSGWVSDMMLR